MQKQREGVIVKPQCRLAGAQIKLVDAASRELLQDPGLLCYNVNAAKLLKKGRCASGRRRRMCSHPDARHTCRYPLEDEAGGALYAAHKEYREIGKRPRSLPPDELQKEILSRIPGILPQILKL